MYYHVSYYRDPVKNSFSDDLLIPANAKNDIEMLSIALDRAKQGDFTAITIYKGYMYKGERRWKTIVSRRLV